MPCHKMALSLMPYAREESPTYTGQSMHWGRMHLESCVAHPPEFLAHAFVSTHSGRLARRLCGCDSDPYPRFIRSVGTLGTGIGRSVYYIVLVNRGRGLRKTRSVAARSSWGSIPFKASSGSWQSCIRRCLSAPATRQASRHRRPVDARDTCR